jgi:hypothetical protein
MLVEATGDVAVFSIATSIVFVPTLEYEDPDSGIWDSEDKVMLFVEKRRIRVRCKEDVDVELTLALQAAGIELEVIALDPADIWISLEAELIEDLTLPEEEFWED